MDETVQARLELLRQEFQNGQQQLAAIEAQRAQLTETLLRISGAIQVLEELTGERPLEETSAASGNGAKEKAKAKAG
jgi:hypothetical protein